MSTDAFLPLPKVLVYLATFNGERFLRAQLDSVLAQEGVDVDVLVADDQSTDGTLKILEEYAAKSNHIRFYVNERRLGYRLNFFSLLHRPLTSSYDFFALSDQDDFWEPTKLSSAINAMASFEGPYLYSSQLLCVDEELKPIGNMFSSKTIAANWKMKFLENTATGCTCLFNPELRDLVLRYPTEKLLEPHDEIIEKIAIATGSYYFDPTPHILYRQHGNNQIGMTQKHQGKKYWELLVGKKRVFHSEVAGIICDLYGDMIPVERLSFIRSVAMYKKSFASRVKSVFSKDFRKAGLRKTLLLKIALLFGKY